jgi:nitrogen fixation NifU-like protein
MADAEATLYRAEILNHAHHPRNSGRLEHPDLAGAATNPLCGDEAQVTLTLAGTSVREIRMLVRGCVIAQAAGSMISEAVRDKALPDIAALGQAFQDLLQGTRVDLPPALEGLRPLVAVRRNHSRIGCALLPWQALSAAMRPPVT